MEFAGAEGDTEFGIPGLTTNEISSLLDDMGVDHEDNVRRQAKA